MRCPMCGEDIPDTSTVCPNCGIKIEADNSPAHETIAYTGAFSQQVGGENPGINYKGGRGAVAPKMTPERMFKTAMIMGSICLFLSILGFIVSLVNKNDAEATGKANLTLVIVGLMLCAFSLFLGPIGVLSMNIGFLKAKQDRSFVHFLPIIFVVIVVALSIIGIIISFNSLLHY